MADTPRIRLDNHRQLRMTPDSVVSIEKMRENAPFKHMKTAGIVEMALATYVDNNLSITTATQMIIKHMNGIETTVLTAVDKAADEIKKEMPKEIATAGAAPRGRPAGSGKSVENDDGRQKLICQALGGTLDGNTCLYRKYEVTPTGRPTDYEVGVPLAMLTQRTVDDQYSPTKESFLATKALEENQ